MGSQKLNFKNMKLQGLVIITVVAIAACNHTGTEEVEKIKSLAQRDSMRAVLANEKDSLITAYLDDLNEMQMTVAEIKELDDWILSNDKKMNDLQMMLKKMDTKNTKLESLVAHLTQETAEKDEEISELQTKLSKANDSVRLVTARFNDSIGVIRSQRAQMSELSAVYYIVGTMKDLKDEGIIDKEGGFIGVGRVAVLNPLLSKNKFLKTNPLSLKGFGLHGKFRRIITIHPDQSYKVINGSKADSFSIVMPSTFWGESKYLVIAIK